MATITPDRGVGTPPTAAFRIDVAIDSDGLAFPLPSCSRVFTWNADGTLATDTATIAGASWRQTYTYSAGNLTQISQWVRQ